MLLELFYTERAHVRMLKVLDSVFYKKLTRENILPSADIKNIFTNLDEIIQLHSTFSSKILFLQINRHICLIMASDLLNFSEDSGSNDSDTQEERVVGHRPHRR